MESSAANTEVTVTPAPRLRAADWLWRPWYAKFWWTVIAAWWLGMAASLKIAPLSHFYASAPAGYLNLLFYPVTALIVLGFGYARARLTALSEQTGKAVVVSPYSVDLDPFSDEFLHRRFGQPHPSLDIYDPRSGVLYVGNPISPNNGARINAS